MKKIDFETLIKIANSEFCTVCKLNGEECCVGQVIPEDTCPILNSIDEAIEVAKKEAVVEWLKSVKAKCGSSCDPNCKFGSLCYMRAMYWEDDAIQKAAEVCINSDGDEHPYLIERI